MSELSQSERLDAIVDALGAADVSDREEVGETIDDALRDLRVIVLELRASEKAEREAEANGADR